MDFVEVLIFTAVGILAELCPKIINEDVFREPVKRLLGENALVSSLESIVHPRTRRQEKIHV